MSPRSLHFTGRLKLEFRLYQLLLYNHLCSDELGIGPPSDVSMLQTSRFALLKLAFGLVPAVALS